MKDGHAPHLLDRARQPLHHMITRPWRVVVEQKGERSPGERGADEKAGDPEAPVDQHGVWLHEEILLPDRASVVRVLLPRTRVARPSPLPDRADVDMVGDGTGTAAEDRKSVV